jgi:CBS domain-containing protein
VKVGDVTSELRAVIQCDETPHQALERMEMIGSRHLPVVDGERWVGMLSMRDLLRVKWRAGRRDQTTARIHPTLSPAQMKNIRYRAPDSARSRLQPTACGRGPVKFNFRTIRCRSKSRKVVGGLEVPWSIVWAPDGRMIFTERPGRVRVFEKAR